MKSSHEIFNMPILNHKFNLPRTQLLLLFALLSINGGNAIAQSNHTPSIPYQSKSDLIVDGNLDDWNKIQKLFIVDQFISPWSSPDFGKTQFKAFYDDTWLYFSFEIEDKNIVEKKFEREEDVARGDRGEIFLSNDADLKNYYCFEIAPSGMVLDYKAKHYRKFDYDWDLEGLEIKSKIDFNGYVLEGKIPMKFINQLIQTGTNKSPGLYIGLFRGEFDSLDWNEKSMNWISWVKPKTDKPDFHIPSAFQWVLLGKK